MATDWVQRYRATVSWGDEMHDEMVNGVHCWWVTVRGQRQYRAPGWLSELKGSIDKAVMVKELTGCEVAITFLDDRATDYQVEEALHLTARAGLGCGFLEPQPCVLHYGLLEKRSEGTLMEKIFG